MPKRDHGQPALSWWGASAPPTQVTISAHQYIGAVFQVDTPGRLFGFRYYRLAGNSNGPWAVFWDTSALKLICAKSFFDAPPAANGWQQTWIRPTIRLDDTHFYNLAILGASQYFRFTNHLPSGGNIDNNHIQMYNGFTVNTADPTAASLTLTQHANGVDLLFQPD